MVTRVANNVTSVTMIILENRTFEFKNVKEFKNKNLNKCILNTKIKQKS